jgi:hypothetical protein
LSRVRQTRLHINSVSKSSSIKIFSHQLVANIDKPPALRCQAAEISVNVNDDRDWPVHLASLNLVLLG